MTRLHGSPTDGADGRVGTAGAARRERGSAAVLVVGAAGALVTVLTAFLAVASVTRVVHESRGIADRAALAAAVPLVVGGVADCAAAEELARADGGRVTGCTARPDGTVVVVAAVPVPPALGRWPGLPDEVSASARAGAE